MEINFKYPILYTFRRCPYAMRARFAIRSSKIIVEIREIKLQEKPFEFLKSSPKGTVPVLITNSGEVLEESLDIIYWALNKNDPHKWLAKGNLENQEIIKLLDDLENKFKPNLDKYKYPSRFSGVDQFFHRDKNLCFLKKLNSYLENNKSLNCKHLSLLDYAIFPFVRQFRNVDQDWFDKLNFIFLNKWINQIIDTKDFSSIMKKFKKWEPNDVPIYTYFE